MNDLERVYATLAQEADTVLLTTSQALRGRADWRTRVRLAAGCVLVVAVVGATTVGAQWALRAGRGTLPGPGAGPNAGVESPSPAPTTSAPSSPAATGSPSRTKPAPTTIPNSAFLQLADTNGDERPTEVPSDNMLPSLCGAKYPSDSSIQARRSMHIVYWAHQHPAGTVPDGTFAETITTYRSDGAVQFVAQLRAAVTACPTQTRNGTTYRHRLLSGSAYGDESILIEMRSPTRDPYGQPIGGDDVRLISVVRVAGVVMVLYEQGWEAGWSADPGVVDTFTKTAVTRLRAWLD
jgi:hypothetical protein